MGIGERGGERERGRTQTRLLSGRARGLGGRRAGAARAVGGGHRRPGRRCSPPPATLARGHFPLPPAPGLARSLKAGPQQSCLTCFLNTFLSLPMAPRLDRRAPSSREGPCLRMTFGFLKPKPPMSSSSRDDDLRFTVCGVQASFSVSVCLSTNVVSIALRELFTPWPISPHLE